MAAPIPAKTLPSGASMPVVGLGTWKSQPGEVKEAVKTAIDLGYRHFDCAYVYGNEDEIGEAFADKIKAGVVKREDLFITSKLWNTFHKREHALQVIDVTLKSLQLDYLDLYLIHWPFPYEFNTDNDKFPRDANGDIRYADVDYTETWQAMEEIKKAGKVRNIGMSNFSIEQLERVKAVATEPIACLQIEIHVYLQNKELISYCKSNNIVVVAYSPLGSPDRPVDPKGGPEEYEPPLQNPVVQKIAAKHNRSGGQVLLRFLVQQDLVVIPKSVNRDRLKQNLELFDFELDSEDIAEFEKLDADGAKRACAMMWDYHTKWYPFGKTQKACDHQHKPPIC